MLMKGTKTGSFGVLQNFPNIFCFASAFSVEFLGTVVIYIVGEKDLL